MNKQEEGRENRGQVLTFNIRTNAYSDKEFGVAFKRQDLGGRNQRRP